MSRNRKLVPVEDAPELKRDVYSQGIVNIDDDARLKAREKRRLALEKIAKEHAREERLGNLEDDVREMKGMLLNILESLKKSGT